MTLDSETLELVADRAKSALTVRAEQLDECLRIATRYSNGIAAWEALCANGRVPTAWLSDERRRFGLPTQFYRRKRALADLDPSIVEKFTLGLGFATRAAYAPVDVRWAAVLASMASSLVEAESLARESFRRANAWFGEGASITVGPNVLWLARRDRERREPVFSIKRHMTAMMLMRYAFSSSPDAPKPPPSMRGRIPPEVDREFNRLEELSRRAQSYRDGISRPTAATLFSLDARSLWVRALKAIAADTPTVFTPARYYTSVELPPKSQIEDPYEPLIKIYELGVRWIAEAPEGIALTTPTPDEMTSMR